MKRKNYLLGIGLSIIIVVFFQCEMQDITKDMDSIDDNLESSSLLKGGSGDQEFGNNLSYPVIWSDGIAKILRGEPGMTPILNGEWWYCWGDEPAEPKDTAFIENCFPDPDNELYCDDGVSGTYDSTNVPGDGWIKAYIQKDASNVWQAGTYDGSVSPVVVDFIDWGDNLESVDWYTRSQVRAEVVLFKTLDLAMLEYTMRHVSGWGINEVHGLAVSQENIVFKEAGLQSTIYSDCARLTIQKLLFDREDPILANLVWVQNEGWIEDSTYVGELLVHPPIFNLPVYEGGDGPGYYAAEINVKGKIIYGYTWDVKKLNDHIVHGGEAAGCYRITFSFDKNAPVELNTFFEEGITEILVPVEEEGITTESSDGEINGGATPVVDFNKNITYIDIMIHDRSGGGHR